jgi:hypothetical protein
MLVYHLLRAGPDPALPPATCLPPYQGRGRNIAAHKGNPLSSWSMQQEGQQQLTPPPACPPPSLKGLTARVTVRQESV